MAGVYEKEDKLPSDEEDELINLSDEEIIGFSIDEYTEKYLLRSDKEIAEDEKKEMDLWKQERMLWFIEFVPEGFVFPPADTPIPKVIEMINDMIKQKARERIEYVEKNGKWNLFLNADGKPYVPENLVRKCAHYPPDMSQFEVWKPTFPLPNTCQGQKGVTNSSDSTADQHAVESSIDSSGEIVCINMEGCKAVELCIAENDSAELRHDISENFETSLMINGHSKSETRCRKVKESQLLGHEISTNKTQDINSSTLQDSVADVKVSTHASIVDEISDQNTFVDKNISDEDVNRTMIVCDLVSQDLSLIKENSASLEERSANEIQGNVESPEVNNVSFVAPEVEYMDIHDINTSSHMIVCGDILAEKAEKKGNKSDEAKETYVSEGIEKNEPVEGKQKASLKESTEKYESEDTSGGIIVSHALGGVKKKYKSEEAKETYVSEVTEKYEPVEGKQKGELEQTTEEYESENVSGGIIVSDEIEGVKKMYKSEEAKETYVSEVTEKYEPVEGKQKGELKQTTEKYESENVSGGIIVSDEIKVVKKMYKSEEAKETYVSEDIEKCEPVEGKQKGELEQTTEKYESENISGCIIVSDEIGVKKMYKSEEAKETYVSEATEKYEPVEGKQKGELEQTTEKYESENISGCIIVSDELEGVKKKYKSETYVSEAIEKYESEEVKGKSSGVRETMLSDEAKNLEKRKRGTKDSVTSSVTTSTISITSEAIPDTEDKEVCLSNVTGDLSDDEVCNKKFKKAEKEDGKILEITDDDDSSNTVLVEETSEEGRSVKQTDTSIDGDVILLSEESVDTAKKIETDKESDDIMIMVTEKSTEMNGNIAAKGYSDNSSGVYSKDRFEVEDNLKDGDEMRVVAIDESSKMLENAYKTDDIGDTMKKLNTETVEVEDDSDDRMPFIIVIQEKHENKDSDGEVQAIMETNPLSTKGMQADEKNVDEGPVKRYYEEDMPEAGSAASNINPSKSDETLQSSGHAQDEQDPVASGEALKRSRQESPSDLYPKKRLMIAVPVEDTHEDSQDSVVQASTSQQMQEPLILSPTNTDTDGSSTVESRHLTEAQATIGEKTESPEESVAPAM